jgi:two-component system cell cycle sensor histidine kinase/response regulator CckA
LVELRQRVAELEASEAERKRAEEALERRVKQLVSLNRASQAVTASLELNQVLNEIISLAGEVTASDYISVMMVDEEGKTVPGAEIVPGVPEMERRIRAEGYTTWIIRSRRAAIVDDVAEDGTVISPTPEGAPPTLNPHLVKIGVKSLAGLPLTVKDHLLGALFLASLRPYQFQDQLPLLTTFANQAAIAIENARLFEQTQAALKKREEAEEALTHEANLLRALMDSLPDYVYFKDTRSRFTRVNKAISEFMGCEGPEDLIGKTDFDFQPLPLAQSFYAEELEIVREGLPIIDRIEYNPTRSGEPRWLSATKAPIFDDQGCVTGLVGISRDITERKRAEEELRKHRDHLEELVAERTAELMRANEQLQQEITERKQAEEALTQERNLLRTLIDNLPDYIYVKDIESRFVIGNVAVGRLMGATTPDELIGKTDFDFYPQELAAQYYADEREIIRSGQPLISREEPLMDMITNRWGWISSTKVPLRDSCEKIVGLVGIGRNITERKRLEEQLRQSQKMEAVGRLAGGVAHDFNNLLTSITGYSSLVLSSLDGHDPLREDVEETMKAAKRAAALTRQLLAFSRGQVLQPKALDLNVVVADMVKMLQRIIGEDIELVTDLAPGLGRTKADPGQIEQVIMNLAVNARDAMPQGGRLTVKTENVTLDEDYCRICPESRPGGFVRLSVADTGVGMDKETLQHIFEPFFTTKKEGTGLGLAVVHGIVGQHEGWIDVHSEPGQGSTFRVYLPAFAVEPEEGDRKRRYRYRSFRGVANGFCWWKTITRSANLP